MTRRSLWAALAVGATLSVVASILILMQSLVIGSFEGHWVYEYIEGFHRRSLLVCGVAVMLCGALGAVPFTVVKRWTWALIVGWLLVGAMVQALMRSAAPHTLEQKFVSDGSNSFYSPTLTYRARTLLGDFERIRRTLPVHARANMPGKLMLIYALQTLSDRPDVLAWIVVGLSNLGAILLYLFVVDLLGDRVVALFSLVLYLLVPARLFFIPMLNVVTPVVVLCCALLWLRWLRTHRVAYAAAFGVALYGLVFFEPTPLAMGLLFAAFTLQALRSGRLTWRVAAVHAGVGAASFLIAVGVVRAWFHFDLLSTLRQVAADAAAFNAEAHRPYGVWVWRNLTDFWLGMGVTQFVLFVTLAGSAVRRTLRANEPLEPAALLSLALAATLVSTDLIGVNRGEVMRLWIFLACFAQVPAAVVCARLNSRAAFILLVGTTLVEASLGSSMVGFAMP